MKLKVIIFGSTGMIGQGVLLECLEDPNVESVLTVVRSPQHNSHPKVKEIVHTNFFSFDSMQQEFSGYNACLFSLGVSAVGLSEKEYRRVTYDLAVGAAEVMLRANPQMVFCYISGKSTNANSSQMWSRVKGDLENKLLGMFTHAYMFRPGFIQPLNGIKSKTRLYNVIYFLFKPFYFLLKHYKSGVTDTSTLARAMISVARNGYKTNILESTDINELGRHQ
jgi:hypothetical protein